MTSVDHLGLLVPRARAARTMSDVFASDLRDLAGNKIGRVHGRYAS